METIVVVEDDAIIRQELVMFLQNTGYGVICIEDFSAIAKGIKQINPSLVLLDVNLGEINGFSACAEIRKTSSVPIIFLTAQNTAMDELNGLTFGADDYIAKPYHPTILLARIKAVLKRTQATTQMQYTHKNLIFNHHQYTITCSTKTETLSKTECKLLLYLFEHKNKVVTRVEIIEYLWDNDVFIDDNALSVNITRLRNKLEAIGLENYIETKRGVGYTI